MAKSMRNLFRTAGLLLVLAAASSGAVARAGLVVTLEVATTPVAGGLTHYEYLLTNLPESGETVGAISVGVSPDADLTSIAGPTGWDILHSPNDVSVAWFSPELDLDLPIGRSAVFSFDSSLAPGPQGFLILGGDFDLVDGSIDGPTVASAVPEPATLAMLAIAGACASPSVVRRRRRTGTPGRSDA